MIDLLLYILGSFIGQILFYLVGYRPMIKIHYKYQDFMYDLKRKYRSKNKQSTDIMT